MGGLFQRVRNRWRRDAARWFAIRPFTLRSGSPVVSFTFDDFPRSALVTGGAILKEHGAVGTYYGCLGLMGQCDTPTGEIFRAGDLPLLVDAGHELGCHTFAHCNAWETPPARFEESVVENQRAVDRLSSGVKLRSLSYPIGSPRPATKHRMAKHFDCCRGGGQTFNTGTVDLNCLAAFFLEQSRDDPGRIKALIDENNSAGGWLIFATHDVAPNPTRFGCTPSLFEEIVRYTAQSQATILPVASAWKAVRGRIL